MKSNYTIHEAHQLLKDKKISSVELTKSYLEKVHKTEPQVHSLVTLTETQALEQAQLGDAALPI